VNDAVPGRNMTLDPYTLAGIAGAAILVAAYFASQNDWVSSGDWRFPLANLVGSVLILVSLYTDWNLPSAVIEAFWAAISLFGLVRRIRRPAPR
jgi:Na+-translocating ferredoxin:NAD+ oxidoreductase RnfD subunit